MTHQLLNQAPFLCAYHFFGTYTPKILFAMAWLLDIDPCHRHIHQHQTMSVLLMQLICFPFYLVYQTVYQYWLDSSVHDKTSMDKSETLILYIQRLSDFIGLLWSFVECETSSTLSAILNGCTERQGAKKQKPRNMRGFFVLDIWIIFILFKVIMPIYLARSFKKLP